ncbi:hypothetical protein TWF730_000450 [Orbilia blumenaviensis]|uniref:Uncharacterized protein n=1 Tax=Orbilia blumenaviensis TaxID=1796055 RepID=A0AAV9VLK9_9PEZI
MADAPDTKVPILAKLDSKTRLLSYAVKDDITAPAQYYPYLLPEDRKPGSTKSSANRSNQAAPNDEGHDRSIIIYGTKTGLTILYPRQCRLRVRRPSADSTNEKAGEADSDDDDGGDITMTLDEDIWVEFYGPNGEKLKDPFRKKANPKAPKYESYSEPEERGVQRNARFPWKYHVELGSPVAEFAVPGAFHSTPEYAYLASHPWLERLYIAAITVDGKAYLIALPLRLPPPVQAPGQLYIWTTEIWEEGRAAVTSESLANLPRWNSTDVSLNFRFFEDLMSAHDTQNIITFYATLKQYGVVRPFCINPFEGTFEEAPPLWAPVAPARGRLPLNMAAKKKILALDLVYPRLWAVLEDGGYGYWDLKETRAAFRLHGECSKPEKADTDVKGSASSGDNASIVVITPIGVTNPDPVCMTRFNHLVKTKGPGSDLEFKLGRVLSHARNQFSLSPRTDSEGSRRLVMTEVGNGFTILEFNLSNAVESYWERQERVYQRVVSQFDKRIEEKLNEPPERSRYLDEKDIEELAALFETVTCDTTGEVVPSRPPEIDSNQAQAMSDWAWHTFRGM